MFSRKDSKFIYLTLGFGKLNQVDYISGNSGLLEIFYSMFI